MIPLIGFVALDLFAKYTGKYQTTSRLLRENKVAAACLLTWAAYHVFVEGYSYGPTD